MTVKFKVFFEPIKKFNKRLEALDDVIQFSEMLRNWTSDRQLSDIINLLNNNKTCVIKTEDCSSTNSHVLENFDLLVKVFELSEIDQVLILNPPMFFYNKIKTYPEKIPVVKHRYKKITEKNIQSIFKNFDKSIIGQRDAKKSICRKLLAQLIRPSSKPLVLMFYGNPGIGKTETAKYLSKTLYGNDNIIREQMTMLGGESSVKYYKATSHSEDSFSKKLLNRSSNLILLDEFLLAPSFFHTTFYQMFDEGKYVDQNFEVDVSNSIIICTSNLLSIDEMEKNIDRALLSRFDGFIKFVDFTLDEKRDICEKVYSEITASNKMKKEYLNKLDKSAVFDKVNNKLNSLSNMRTIRKYMEDCIADSLLLDIIEKK